MGRLAKIAFTVSYVFLLSLRSFAANQPPEPVTYDASVERVYAAEMQAFGAPPTSLVKEQCLVNYRPTKGTYRDLWTAACKDLGNGKVGVTLTVQGQWFFGSGDERKKVANVFWNNMNVLLKNTGPSGSAPAPSPLVAPPASPQAAPSTVPPEVAPPASPQVALPASPQVEPPASPQVAPPASEASVIVQISSKPSGADIMVDGDYAGSTPSHLKLKSGSHSVKITKKGFAPWERSIKVESGESRNIAAELEKARR
jgi:PEGA domain-containing protein